MRAQLHLQTTVGPLLEQLYICVRQEVPIRGQSFRRLWRWRGDYRVALDSPKYQSRAPVRRHRQFSFSFLHFVSNVGLVHKQSGRQAP